MKFWDKLFKRKKGNNEITDEGWEENAVLRREDINMHDGAQRDKYVRSCLEQIQEASRETDELTAEYTMVTSYLTDMEEVEALPLEEKKMIAEQAGKVVNLLGEQKKIMTSSNRMSDTDYKHMERIQDDMPEGYQKLKDCEDYHELVKNDLKRLAGERHAYYYRRNELCVLQENIKGISIIAMIAMGAACVILFILQMSLMMDVRIGYLLTIGMGAVALTYLYVKYMDTTKEHKKVELSINKLILLQIRYVNNTNLLDYYYMKYGIDHSEHLKELWDLFLVEREERAKIEKANEELDFYSGGLISLLARYHIKDPSVWIRQAEALLNDKEMVEIRHNLITRRQALRKQMEYNRHIADTAHGEIKDLVMSYPKYAQEIMAIVSQYS